VGDGDTARDFDGVAQRGLDGQYPKRNRSEDPRQALATARVRPD